MVHRLRAPAALIEASGSIPSHLMEAHNYPKISCRGFDVSAGFCRDTCMQAKHPRMHEHTYICMCTRKHQHTFAYVHTYTLHTYTKNKSLPLRKNETERRGGEGSER